MRTTIETNIRDANGRHIGLLVEDDSITLAAFTDAGKPVVFRKLQANDLYRWLGVVGPAPQIIEPGRIKRLLGNEPGFEVAFDSGGACLYFPLRGETANQFWARMELLFECYSNDLPGRPIHCVMSSVGAGYIVSISNPKKKAHEG